MFVRIFARIAVLAIASGVAAAACSTSRAAPRGQIVVAFTMDWEGASLASEELDAVDALRNQLGAAVPLTHFVSAAYFTKDSPDPNMLGTLAALVRTRDELAVHLHAWRSLATAAGVAPKLSPSFLSGTDKLLDAGDGDAGFDTDLDVYDVVALRALVRTSRQLLEQAHIPVSHTFRAGGYLGTPKVLEAIAEEGIAVDSSATDFRHLSINELDFLKQRLAELWPQVTSTSQPFEIATPGGTVLEMPIAAITDYVPAKQIVRIIEAAHAQLQAAPERDVFVVLAFHLETAPEYAHRIAEAMAEVRARPDIAAELVYYTVQDAAVRFRRASP